MFRKSLASVAGCVCLLLAACGGGASTTANTYANPAQGVATDQVRFGFMNTLTGPQSTDQSKAYMDGYQTYINMINAQGGVNGRKIAVDVEDDQFTVTTALTVYDQLANQNPVLATVGSANSSIINAVLPKLLQDKLPYLGAQSLLLAAVSPTPNPYYFTIQCSYEDQTAVGFAYEQQQMQTAGISHPKLAVLSANLASGVEWQDAWKAQVQKAGWTYLGNTTFPNSAVDLTAVAQKMAQLQPDVIAVHGGVTTLATLVKAMAATGMKTPHMLGLFSLEDAPTFSTMPASYQQNFQVAACYPNLYAGSTLPGYKALYAAATKYGFQAEVPTTLFGNGWVLAQVMVQALKQSGTSPTRDKFVQALNSINNLNTGSISPVISFSPTNHVGIRGAIPYTYDAGKNQWVANGTFADWAKYLPKNPTDFV